MCTQMSLTPGYRDCRDDECDCHTRSQPAHGVKTLPPFPFNLDLAGHHLETWFEIDSYSDGDTHQVIGYHWDYDIALTLSKGRGAFGGDAILRRVLVLTKGRNHGWIIPDSQKFTYAEIPPGTEEQIKQTALSKLTHAEKKLLGLVK